MHTATATNIDFRIPASKIASASNAYRELVTDQRTPIVRINEQLMMKGHKPWPLPGAYRDSLRSVFEAYGFSTCTGRRGALSLTGFAGSLSTETMDLLGSVSRYAALGSHIFLALDDGYTCKIDLTRQGVEVTEHGNKVRRMQRGELHGATKN